MMYQVQARAFTRHYLPILQLYLHFPILPRGGGRRPSSTSIFLLHRGLTPANFLHLQDADLFPGGTLVVLRSAFDRLLQNST